MGTLTRVYQLVQVEKDDEGSDEVLLLRFDMFLPHAFKQHLVRENSNSICSKYAASSPLTVPD